MKIYDKFTVEERDLIGESSKIEDRDYSIDEIRYIKSNVIDNIFQKSHKNGDMTKALEVYGDIIEKFDTFLINFNEKFPIALNEIISIAQNVNTAAVTINTLAGNIDNTVENNTNTLPIIINNFNKTMIEIGEAANSLKNLADFLERHPESLLKGKGK